jgi:hypothetical protein
MADGSSVTLTLEYLSSAIPAPAEAIAARSASVVLSLTEGCDTPLEALKLAPLGHQIRCHPCDEAIVRLLMSRTLRAETLQITYSVSPGTLCLG